MEARAPCAKIDVTGEIVEASAGIAIAYLNRSSSLGNGTILVKGPIIPNLQPRTSELAVEARRAAETRDQKGHKPTASGNQLQNRHEYVLNCADNGSPKYKRCSGFPYKYYCKSNGYIDFQWDNSPYCDEWCTC
jgi:hypothetical protein